MVNILWICPIHLTGKIVKMPIIKSTKNIMYFLFYYQNKQKGSRGLSCFQLIL